MIDFEIIYYTLIIVNLIYIVPTLVDVAKGVFSIVKAIIKRRVNHGNGY